MSKRKRRENGQSLILVALLLVVFIGILALVFDGGYTYFMRRNAQNAADAGALAGARIYCETLVEADGINEAVKYVHENDALVSPNDLPPYLGIDITGNRVTVDTYIEFDNFFGKIFGRDKTIAPAHAVAGCYSPSLAEGVLPIIWYCKPSLTGGVGGGEECLEQFINWEQLQTYLAQNPLQLNDELYIVMDDLKLPDEGLPCIEDDPVNGIYICDWDGDGKLDKIGSSRGWTNLDGWDGNPDNPNCFPDSDSVGELEYWIAEGYECPLETHTWTPKSNFSNPTGLYAAAACRVNQAACNKGNSKGPLVLLPVYDDDCPRETPASGKLLDCKPPLPPEIKWHDGVDTIRFNNPADKPYYFHIINFAPFYITCIRTPDGIWTQEGKLKGSADCPGYKKLEEKNPIIKGNNTKSVEGYFLWGYVPGLEGRGDDDFLSRVFTVYLDE